MKFKDIVDEEKPREKLKKYGVENLSDVDLLSIVLRTGNKDNSVVELSNNIIKEIGGLSNLKNIGLNTLFNIKGIKLSKASIILASIEIGRRCFSSNKNLIKLTNSMQIYNTFKDEFIGVKQEKFYILLFDIKMNLIIKKEIGKGTSSGVLIDPKGVFKEAIKESASFIVIMHNHPSGDTTPSKEDIELTNSIIYTGNIIGIKVVDHIIISPFSYYSFYENGVKSDKNT